MAKTIYVVTEGDYSDFHIEAIFTTKERAEKYMAATRNGDNIEEYVLDEDGQGGLYGFWVIMDYDGKSNSWHGDKPEKGREVEFFKRPRWEPGPFQKMKTYVKAKNKEHAVKVANERRAQLIAANEWPMNEPPAA